MKVKAPFYIDAEEIHYTGKPKKEPNIQVFRVYAWFGNVIADVDKFIVPLQEEKDGRHSQMSEAPEIHSAISAKS